MRLFVVCSGCYVCSPCGHCHENSDDDDDDDDDNDHHQLFCRRYHLREEDDDDDDVVNQDGVGPMIFKCRAMGMVLTGLTSIELKYRSCMTSSGRV